MPGATSIRSWPTGDRPREKLASAGPAALSDAELLAIVLRTGEQGNSALDQARSVLAALGDFRALAGAGSADLCRIRGIGPVKAAQIIALIEIAKRYGEREFKPGVT